VALDRFIAWDRFKERAIRGDLRDKRPVSGVIRKLFADSLVRKNAEAAGQSAGEALETEAETAGLPFRVLIPPAFARDGQIFAGEIARILPSLALLKARRENAAASKDPFPADEEDRDFGVLETIYALFLDQNDLFEPSWEKPPLGDKTHEYYLFFPEAMEDFIEYEPLLRKEPTIHLVSLEDEAGEEDRGDLWFYDSVREEIRAAVREIRRLFEEEGVPYEDMAVSVPGIEDMDAYLPRELELYAVPFRRRSGRPLADYGTGKVFSLINDCGVNAFSFGSLKSLLFNEQLPWLYPDLNRGLIEFGVNNNCVSAYREKGRPVDVWEAAFKNRPREERLRNYYALLKGAINGMTNSRTFRELRNRYFAFRRQVWSGDFSGEGNDVLSRCIEELSTLIQLEEEFPDLIPPSPFSFYLSALREKQYVSIRSEGGVNIFPYRVAAAAPFRCHFVLNAAQDAATVLYQPLKFLRQDKRKRLGIGDTDASAAFFRLYVPTGEGGRVRFSASERTFRGWTIPHSLFAGHISKAPPPASSPEDSFAAELDFWEAAERGEKTTPFPAAIFPVQREGFRGWFSFLPSPAEDTFTILHRPFASGEEAARLLRDRIANIQAPEKDGSPGAGNIRVSATDLNNFFFCPSYWLYRKIFGLTEYEPEAKLLDDISLGLLYHDILKNLFSRIQAEDPCFMPEHLDRYRQWAGECAREAALNFPAFQGPLAAPLLASLSKALAGKITGLLKAEAKYFASCAVSGLELPLVITRPGAVLNGRLDRVSVSPEGEEFIIDYKTKGTPSKKDSTLSEDAGLADFQMPMYVRLYEEARGRKIGGAFFFSINQHDITAVIGSPGGKKGQSREDYQKTLDALETYIDSFTTALQSLDFSSREIVFGNCAGCEYKNICRVTFSLNKGPGEEAPRVD
jgi:CRISPR/Cas system-associated exonuclease Cas4 (RecB family)